MNLQAAVAVEKNPMDSLAIEEIFYTLQGEGPFSGCPAVFVRLSGCSLSCLHCDTSYSSFHPYSVQQTVDEAVAVKSTAELCVVTGGEPFRQYQMPMLLQQLLRHFAIVQLETSGSCFQPKFAAAKELYKERIQVICSPKTVKLHPDILPYIDGYKYVVRHGCVDDDGLPNEEPQQHKSVCVAKPHASDIPVFISPWDEHDEAANALNIQQAVESCLQHGYFLSLQVHKLVNLR